MKTLTTDILKENIVEILPVVGARDSFFSKVGVRDITVSNLDLVRKTSVGPAGIVFEGQVKPDTTQKITDAPVERFKSVATVRVSKELQLDREGQAILENLLVDGARSLIDAPAVALLAGLDLAAGEEVIELEDMNLYENGLEFDTSTDTPAVVEAINELVFANGQMGGTLVVNGTTWASLAGANAPGLPGGRLFPNLNDARAWDFANTRGGFQSPLIDAANASEKLDKDLLAVVGPFSSNVGVSINVNDVRVFREQWKDINLASLNEDLYVLEADVAMYVLEPESFNVLKASN